MAKRKTDDKPTNQAQPPVQLAVKAICCVTGCGAVTAQQILSKLPTASIAEIANAEATGNRSQVPKILATIKDSDDDSTLPPGGESSDASAGS